MDKVDLLIGILLDPTARVDERDDAAISLGAYNDDRALNALISIVLDSRQEEFIKDVCGESIAMIWTKRDYFDVNLYNGMADAAQREVYAYVKSERPDWIDKYNLENPF